MTRSELLAAIGYELSKNVSSMDTTTQNRLLGYLNQRHRRLLSAPGLQHLRDAVITFTSAASQSLYGLPNVAKVNRIWDAANNRTLGSMSIDQYRTLDPRATLQTGIPESWVWFGYGNVAKQPSDASALYVKSTSASDGAGVTARVEATITGNYQTSLSSAMNGTTAAQVGAISTVVDISKFYLSAAAVGTVTLLEDSGSGTELARISIGQKQQRYYQLYLWRTPASAVTYTADVTREITDFAQDADEPLIPQDFHDLLVLGVVMDEYRHTSDDRYGAIAGEFGKREREFKYWLHESASGNSTPEPPSQLGAWCPSGT